MNSISVKLYEPNDAQSEKLRLFEDLVTSANQKINLVSKNEEKHIQAHIADSLTLLPHFESYHLEVLDFGSGGGFPVIPLAICQENVRFTAIDSSERKCDFLSLAKRNLSLNNLNIINNRIENLENIHNSFDLITARAFKPLNVILPLSLPFLKKKKGEILLIKGESYQTEIDQSKDIIKKEDLKLEVCAIHNNIDGRRLSAVIRVSSINE